MAEKYVIQGTDIHVANIFLGDRRLEVSYPEYVKYLRCSTPVESVSNRSNNTYPKFKTIGEIRKRFPSYGE